MQIAVSVGTFRHWFYYIEARENDSENWYAKSEIPDLILIDGLPKSSVKIKLFLINYPVQDLSNVSVKLSSPTCSNFHDIVS